MIINNKSRLIKYRYADRGDLTQTIIIIAGFAVAAIVAIGGITTVIMDKGEDTANCIANQSAFTPMAAGNTNNDCSAKEDESMANFTENEKKIAADLQDFNSKIRSFYSQNGRHPYTGNDELNTLRFQVTNDAYPEHISWNFDYCRSVNTGEYIVTVHSSDNEVMYISSNNSVPIKYDAGHESERLGQGSPCYSGTSFSAADRTGLGQVGRIDENGTLVGGISGKGNDVWRSWTQGGI